MTFNSLQYAAFFGVVLLAYWRLPRRGQNVLLLVASYIFYGAFDYRFLGLLLLSTGLDYWFGLSISRSDNDRVRRRWLFASLAVNLGILGFFKYFDFFVDSAADDVATRRPRRRIPRSAHPAARRHQLLHVPRHQLRLRRLPPPHTSRREVCSTIRLFVAFFPQLVAGPIGRRHLQLPQFERDRVRPTRERVVGSLVLILIGLFKKVVIADGVAAVVADAVFVRVRSKRDSRLLSSARGFALQIYGDFSGYTDIARGSVTAARHRAAASTSASRTFARTSPSSGDGGTSRCRTGSATTSTSRWAETAGAMLATYRNLIMTMLLGGLWHGASWTFVVWGGLHGMLLALDRLLGRDRDDVSVRSFGGATCSILVTANIATLLFVIFRAESLREAFHFFAGIFTGRGGWTVDLNSLFIVGTAALGDPVAGLGPAPLGRSGSAHGYTPRDCRSQRRAVARIARCLQRRDADPVHLLPVLGPSVD